jgi:hypothetical protein
MLSQIYPFVSTFKHTGVQSILNEENPSWNKIEPFIFFDEANCGPLHMLYYMVLFLIIGFQHYFAPCIVYRILQNFTSNEY